MVGQGESVAAVTGWISNLGTTVAQAFDDVVHVSDGDHGGAQAAGGRPAASKSGGGGSNQNARQGQGARQRSELEQQAYELKVSSVPHPVASNPGSSSRAGEWGATAQRRQLPEAVCVCMYVSACAPCSSLRTRHACHLSGPSSATRCVLGFDTSGRGGGGGGG